MQKTNIGKVVLVVVTLGVLFALYWLIFHNRSTHYSAPADAPIPVAPLVVSKDEPFNYIEIIDGCGPYFTTGTCVNMRTGPSVNYPASTRLRTGVVLKVKKTTVPDEQVVGRTWYQVTFNESRLYRNIVCDFSKII